MKKSLYEKGFVLGIIALFVGVALAPGITASVNITDDNNNLVEITVQVGIKDHTVMLSSQQTEELEQIISRTKTELDAAKTKEETSRIFNDTVVLLYELGVLPKDMSIEEAKRLVNGMEQNSKFCNKLKHCFSRNQGILDNQNFLCLIAGHTDNTIFIGHPLIYLPPFLLLSVLLISLFDISPFDFEPLLILGILIGLAWQFNPLPFGYTIIFGFQWTSGGWPPLPVYYPANGWVHTIGLNGIKNWSGELSGKLSRLPILDDISLGTYGFTGIRIHYPPLTHFYMGAALRVKIEEEHP